MTRGVKEMTEDSAARAGVWLGDLMTSTLLSRVINAAGEFSM